jgi:hypothetical protein
MGSEDWSDGVLERWVRKCVTPTLHYSNPGAVMEQSKLTIATVLIASTFCCYRIRRRSKKQDDRVSPSAAMPHG